jgi:uncharacterized protein (DUF427 family)
MTALQRSDLSTYCPYKGDCSYFSIPIGGERSANAVWTCENPTSSTQSTADLAGNTV